MPTVTVQDLLEEASYTADSSGVKAVRKFLVTGLDEVAHKKLYQAALLPGIPQRSQAHPGIPNLVCDSVSVVPAPSSPTKAYVVAVYSSPVADNTPPSESATPTLEVGATVSETQRVLDKDSTKIIVSFAGRPDQHVPVNVQAGNPYITFSRREPKPFNKAKVNVFVGSVNSVPWFGDPARTWLCTAIRARLNGDAFDVSYEFQYDRFTYDVEVIYTDENGTPIKNYVEGVGRKTFRVYSEADFNQLNLGV